MTIEERARAYATEACEKYGNEEQIFSDAYNEYIEIAEEQKKIDIAKACEWMKNNLGYYDRHSVYVGKTYEDAVTESFRKAMEEEL